MNWRKSSLVVLLGTALAIVWAGPSLSVVQSTGNVGGSGPPFLLQSGQASSPGLKVLPAIRAMPSEGLSFGESVAVSGDYAVVGAYTDGNNSTKEGSARVFVRNGATWIEAGNLAPSTDRPQAQFGFSVDLSATVVLVGAPVTNSAHLFVLTGGSWTELAELRVAVQRSDARFGHSVAIDGNYAVVGAPGVGSAYVYEHSGGTWSEVAVLTSQIPGTDRGFGQSVALSGDTLVVVGGPEGPAVYRRQDGTWTHEGTLTSPNSPGFGRSVDISGDHVVVGANGSAILFARHGATWTNAAVLTGSDTVPADDFGASVGINGNSVLVGAPAKTNAAGAVTGAAYLFAYRSGAWTESSLLSPDNSVTAGNFGHSVGIDLDHVIVGAPQDGDEFIVSDPMGNVSIHRTGAAYLYRH